MLDPAWIQNIRTGQILPYVPKDYEAFNMQLISGGEKIAAKRQIDTRAHHKVVFN